MRAKNGMDQLTAPQAATLVNVLIHSLVLGKKVNPGVHTTEHCPATQILLPFNTSAPQDWGREGLSTNSDSTLVT
jgi:hypothetical protein